MSLISINGNELNPLVHTETLRASGLQSGDTSKSNYILVQAAKPLSVEQEEELEKLGVAIHEYVSENTYLCAYKGSDLSSIRTLSFVNWANDYLNLFVVQSDLKSQDSSTQTLSALSAVPKSSNTHVVDVMLHHDVDPSEEVVKSGIATAAHVDPANIIVCTGRVRLTVEEQYLEEIATLDSVRMIKKFYPAKLFNNKAVKVLNDDKIEVNGTTYQGGDQIIAVADTGFDKGDPKDTHPAFNGRVKKLYPLGRKEKTDDPDGHGTHVCGSALGDGNSDSMGGRIAGTAPKASLVLQSVMDDSQSLGGIPSDLGNLFSQVYKEDGARIHTNSWGSSSPFSQLPYDGSANDIDKFVWENQDMIILFAAGNDGTDSKKKGVIDSNQIGSQSSAKNCITIGASENDRPDIDVTYGSKFGAAPFKDDRVADNPEGMAAFSSRGPTKEGRMKPDVVAPGTCILSTRSRNLENPNTSYGKSSDPAWWFLAGTSMATPLAAGCVAVIRESLVKNKTEKPSAALVKALLINGAVELSGQYDPSEAGPSPNVSSGFGRINVKNSIVLPDQEDGGFREGGPLKQDEGDDDPVKVSIPKDDSLLKVTLVWSDPPGDKLQNDLDLVVIGSDGTERHGNMGDKEDFDRTNNVEQVVWSGIPSGDAKIVVRAHHIAKKESPQPYAVAWSINRPTK